LIQVQLCKVKGHKALYSVRPTLSPGTVKWVNG
jgi:hypothetical protein